MTDVNQPLFALTALLQRVIKTHRGALQEHLNRPPTIEEIFEGHLFSADNTSNKSTSTTLTASNTDVVDKCENIAKENYFCYNDTPDKQLPPKSLHEIGRQFSRKKFITDADLNSIFTLLRKAIDTVHAENSANSVSIALEIDRIIDLIKPLALFEMRTAAYMIVLIGNIAANKELCQQVNVTFAWDFVRTIAKHYIYKQHIIQLIFFTISNMAYLDGLKLTRTDCQLLICPIYYGYTTSEFVEAWTTMLCNITAHHPETHQVFIELGVVETLQRLILYIGEEGKTALRGIQSLSNLATGFVNGHFPALEK